MESAMRNIVLAVGIAVCATPVAAQTTHPAVHVSFFTNAAVRTPTDGTPRSSTQQLITAATVERSDGEGNGLEYAFDMRQSAFLADKGATRLSVHDAFIGGRTLDGRLRARLGGMWLTDLGGLGAVAGALVEFRRPPTTSAVGRLRSGVFFGVEPDPFKVNYVHGVRKYGAYAVLDAPHGRKHAGGYVRTEHSGLVERSVVTFNNFVPLRSRVFVYQSGEYDLTGPAGQGRGGLTYFFVNGRAMVTPRVDVQGIYHRGRSIDTRTITDDVLNGRPVPVEALSGLLYESAGTRVTVEVFHRVRVNGGYTRDRNNRDSTATGRVSAGFSAMDIARTGIDLTVSASRTDQSGGRFGSRYVSIGRQFGRAVYVSGDYASSLATVAFVRTDGIVLVSRPSTRQIGVSGVLNLRRGTAVLVTAEHGLDDGGRELRLLTGLTYRFK
jgi:hypothetical protein